VLGRSPLVDEPLEGLEVDRALKVCECHGSVFCLGATRRPVCAA
jgi:hypothetical protein